ncbi:MAG: DNA-binding response regulator [Gammaproteobacteria bacterium]|nr:MAG: DNA-binding response regulator [Gammaproteobacteria bacterium]
MIRVLIVDDHDLVRAGIVRLLQDVADIEVVGECGSGEEALTACQTLNPDIVLLDLHMPGMGGMEAARRIVDRFRNTKVIVLTAESEAPISRHTLKCGVAGYVTKGTGIGEMVKAIRTVRAGQRYLSPVVAQKLALSGIDGDTSPLDKLSKRELEVLIRISRGQSNREIAEALHLSPKTTSTYRARLLEKLNASNDVELARICHEAGLLNNVPSDG